MQDFDVLFKIEQILAGFSQGLTIPECKFLKDLVFGILRSQSSLLSEISRAIAVKQEVKRIYKRLDINLGRYDLTRCYERAQTEMLERVDETFLFIFDPSEIVKPFAKKMEGLALVRDASEKPLKIRTPLGKTVEKHPLKPGYPLRVAIAMSQNGDILPIELSLYSCASEFFISENDEYIQALETLIHKTHFAPVLVLDREFDVFSIMRHLCELRQRFIVRVTKNRKYRVAGDVFIPGTTLTYDRQGIIEKHAYLSSKEWITYTRNGKVKTLLFEFKATNVELLSEQKKSGVFRDPGDDQALTLVQVKIRKETGTPTLYLLTNSRPETAADLTRIGKSYLARWNIEEYIRFLKQHFSLEDFLVRDLGRMKNLVRATYIATVVIHLLTDRTTKKGFHTHHHLLTRSLPVNTPKLSRDFFLYSYGMGLANIVELNKKLLTPSKGRSKKSGNAAQLQMGF